MRLAALLFAVSASLAWGVGAVLIKRWGDSFSSTTLLAFQYTVGLLLIVGWLAANGGLGAARHAAERHWC